MMFDQAGNVHRVPAIAPLECAAVAERLRSLRKAWTQRGRDYYTLGAAVHLDICRTKRHLSLYDARRSIGNEILAGHFADLLATVRARLESALEDPCDYSERLALPGFHIFLAESLSSNRRDPLHLDLQYSFLQLSADMFTPTATFTLPIVLPVAGGGLEICDRSIDQVRGRLRVENYELGELLIHSGRALHRRAYVPVLPTCARITLQGHGLKLDGRWLIYW